MKTILFSDLAGYVRLRIKEMLESEPSFHRLVRCTHLTEFIDAIRHASGHAAMAALAPPPKTSLTELVFIRELLNRLKIVMVLKDHRSEAIALAHSLSPRGVTFADDDLANLAGIVNQIAALQ